MEWEECVGEEFLFYGVDNETFKLNDIIWEAIEGDSDSYRSELAGVQAVTKKGIFFREPVAIVRVEVDEAGDNSGYKLVDIEYDHTWVEMGTNSSDSYYPMFYFNYYPRAASKKSKLKKVRTSHVHDIDPFDRLFEEREG